MTLELDTLEAGRKKWQRLGFFRGLFVGSIIFGLFLLFYFNKGLDVSEPRAIYGLQTLELITLLEAQW
jgi:hypothetical protein